MLAEGRGWSAEMDDPDPCCKSTLCIRLVLRCPQRTGRRHAETGYTVQDRWKCRLRHLIASAKGLHIRWLGLQSQNFLIR